MEDLIDRGEGAVIGNADDPENDMKCPVCGCKVLKDESSYESNGVLGHGFRSWRTKAMFSCSRCGVYFKPVKGNGL